MSLAQDFRNAWDARDRDEFERLLGKLPVQMPTFTIAKHVSCGHMKGSCETCHQCLKDAGSTRCPTCSGT